MSNIPVFTTVTGVDHKHLQQLGMVWPTWKKWKPDIVANPMAIFYEREWIKPEMVRAVCDHPRLSLHPWPPEGTLFSGDDTDKWNNIQRHKMLAGFVYIPALFVRTPYFLKLDTDAVAMGQPDWIDPAWFDDNPAIISHPWGFTRPPDQMLRLDAWVEQHKIPLFEDTQPLNLIPRPGESRLSHRRIGSWCAFFRSDFNFRCAKAVRESLDSYQLPVASQDGFLWYCAARLGEKIIRPSMKKRGWNVWSTELNIRNSVQESLRKENGPTVET